MIYVYGIIALVIAGLVAAVAVERSEATSARAEAASARAALTVAVDANNASQAVIGRLRATAEANDKLLVQMAADLAAIQKQTDETNDAIGALKEANADVAAYLHGAVPDGLRVLLNK